MFLVQCYRRLIERDVGFQPGKSMRPARLRELLEDHIFGVDRDGDACRVAELSLQLTLLDYVDPPDLESTPSFQHPQLHDRNIFQADFFAADTAWQRTMGDERFDWIVGNPPWVELKKGKVKAIDKPAWTWLNEHKRNLPAGGNQVVEAFAWRAADYVAADGRVAFVLPAMTLFKDESADFRRQFFERMRVNVVANFANLAYVLFGGASKRGKRPERPAAVFFYSPAHGDQLPILVYSPLTAEQLANRPDKPGKQLDTWSLTINASDIRELRWRDIANGEALPWKLAMWGSHRDQKLLESLADEFPAFGRLMDRWGLAYAEGIQLRTKRCSDDVEYIAELVGKKALSFSELRSCGRIHDLPESAKTCISEEQAFLRLRGGRKGLTVSRPPHIIVDRSRRFAVYSDEFIAVLPRQIGIAGTRSQAALLQALALYLNSDFVLYHQFLCSPEWGVSTSSSTLEAMKQLPIPFDSANRDQLHVWSELHSAVVEAWRTEQSQREDRDRPLFAPKTKAAGSPTLKQLEREMNDHVYQLLGLRDRERWLVEDLVHVRMDLIQGKVSEQATRPPTTAELQAYAEVFQGELDSFVASDPELHHEIVVVHDSQSAMIQIHMTRDPRSGNDRTHVCTADGATAREFTAIRGKLRKQHSQWVYFDRNLRIYSGRKTYLFKPMQMLQWTRSQALLDAGEIIAETLT